MKKWLLLIAFVVSFLLLGCVESAPQDAVLDKPTDVPTVLPVETTEAPEDAAETTEAPEETAETTEAPQEAAETTEAPEEAKVESTRLQADGVELLLMDWQDCATLFETADFTNVPCQYQARLSVNDNREYVVDWLGPIDETAVEVAYEDVLYLFGTYIDYETAQFVCDPLQVVEYLNKRWEGDGSACDCQLLVSTDTSFPPLLLARQNEEVHVVALNENFYTRWWCGAPYPKYYDAESFPAPCALDVYVDGTQIDVDAYRMYEGYRLPMFATLKAMSATIGWEDGCKIAQLGNGTLVMSTETPRIQLMLNGEPVEDDMLIEPGDWVNLHYTDEEFYCSEPFLSFYYEEVFGYTLEYDEEEGAIYLTYRKAN